MDKISKVCDYNNCVGCSLCTSVCPQKAISISQESGFYRPIINDKCVGCKKCVNLCPSNSISEINNSKKETPPKAYAAWNNDKEIHKNSTSGGIAYTIAKKIIIDGGFAVGVWFNPKTQRVEHRIYENVDDLHFMQGSKYVQSNKDGIYVNVVELLKQKQGVFIGVSCEVFAMKQYLNLFKNLELNNLYFIDLLCRGGSSPLCLSQHIKKISKTDIDNISFRGGDYDCRFTLWKNDKVIYQDAQFEDPYFRTFMRHTILQPACFDCKFCGSRRLGDITLGDFWGLDKKIEEESPVQGINMILVNSKNGELLLSNVKDDLFLKERNTEEAINGNETLRFPTIKEEEYDELWEEIRKTNFHEAYKKVYKTNWNKNNWKIKRMKAKIKAVIKRIIGRSK